MEDKKEIKIKFTTVIILILVLVIIGLGIYFFLISDRDVNVNLSSTNLENNIDGQDKVLSLIESLNINKEFYKKEKIEVNDKRDIGNGESLTLKEYAYDNEILIVNFIYKANSEEYGDVCLEEDVYPLLGITMEEGGCIPVYNINFKSVKQDNNYYICNVYDMSKLNIEENRINLTIMDVYNYGEFDSELNRRFNEKFMIDVSNNKITSEVYSLDSNVIELDLKELEKKNKIDTDASENAEFEIGKIVESNLATLIQFNSNFDLDIITEIIDNDTYTSTSPSYSFEIINENGKILNTRDDQKLALSMDAKSQILIIDSLNNSKNITIKVYEDVTNTLLAEKQIDIEKTEIEDKNNIIKENVVTNNEIKNEDNKNKNDKKVEENKTNDDEVKSNMKDKAEELIDKTEDEVIEQAKKAKRAVYESEALEELMLLTNEVLVANYLSEKSYTGYINKDTLEYTKKNKGMKAKKFYESKLKEKGYIVEVAVDSEGHPTISHIEYEED